MPVVVSNFEQFYQKELNRRRQEKDKRDEEKRKRKNEQFGEEIETSGMLGNGPETSRKGHPTTNV